jgi:hypothetical protein
MDDFRTVTRVERLGARVLLFSLILPLPWQPNTWGFTIFPFVLVLLPLLAMWMLERSSPGGRHRARTKVKISYGCIVWAAVFCGALALLSAVSNSASTRYAFLFLYLAGLAAFCLVRLPMILDLKEICVALMIDVLIVGTLSLVQFISHSAIGALAQYFQPEPIQNSLAYLSDGATLKRVQGTFSGAAILAQWLTYVSIFLFGYWCSARSRFVLFPLLVCLGTLVLTFTRSAWSMTILGCAVLAWSLVTRRILRFERFLAIVGAVLVGIIVLFAFAPSTWTGRLVGGTVSGDLSQRNALTEGGITVALHYPALGVGYLRFLERSPDVRVHEPERPHNVFVQIAAEQGVLVLAAFLTFFASLAVAIGRSVGRPRWLRSCGGVLLGVWFAFMFVFDIASDYALLPTIVVLICVCIGYPMAANAGAVTQRDEFVEPAYA